MSDKIQKLCSNIAGIPGNHISYIYKCLIITLYNLPQFKENNKK
jgi:hypothetical protein